MSGGRPADWPFRPLAKLIAIYLASDLAIYFAICLAIYIDIYIYMYVYLVGSLFQDPLK